MTSLRQSDTTPPAAKHSGSSKILRRIFKFLCFAIMALVLFVSGILICTVTVLSPDKLTPLVEKAGNRCLNADVKVGKVELSVRASFPFLVLKVDSLVVLSRDIRRLPKEERDSLGIPSYADTLMSVESFKGGLNLLKLAKGEIELSDVIIHRPGLNLVVAGDSLNNFNIFPYTSEEDTLRKKPSPLPALKIKKFAIYDPKPFRYYHAQNRNFAQINLSQIVLEGQKSPLYNFRFNGNFQTPVLGDFNLSDFPFVINGTVEWNPRTPAKLKLSDFNIGLAFTESELNADLDFAENFVVNSLEYKLKPLPLTDLLSTVPDSLKQDWGIGGRLETSASISISAKLNQPYNTGTDLYPYASVNIDIPPCEVRYGPDQINDFSLSGRVETRGNNLDLATLEISSLKGKVRAGNFDISGNASNIKTDLNFNGNVKLSVNLNRLPQRIKKYFDGFIEGSVKVSISGHGRLSQCNAKDFHKLKIKGGIDIDKAYWIRSDTVDMAYVNHGQIKLNTNTTHRYLEQFSDSLLKASVTVDSAVFLQGKYRVEATGLDFNFGCKNDSHSSDTTIVMPLGGKVDVKKFNFTVLTDTFSLRIRDIDGTAVIRRYADRLKVPEFIFDLGLGRVSVGSPRVKMLISEARLDAGAIKLPSRKIPPKVKHYADSLRMSMPYISADSLYLLAVEKAREHRGKYHRVHPELTKEETEIIDWGTSDLLRRLLLNWSISGRLSSERAGLFTPYFPLRNRMRNLNVKFNNDSIIIDQVQYKAGGSDFLVSGVISNLRRSLTSDGFRKPMKINFVTYSDSIDVNEIAGNIFAGARYADSHRKDFFSLADLDSDSDEALAKEIGKEVENAPASGAPLMIPSNIDARVEMKADNITYSDIPLKNFRGELLVYKGGLNLHQLGASSSVGSIDLSALYSSPSINNLEFAFGLNLKRFNIERFRRLVPPVDSVIPMLSDLAGIIDVDIAATVKIDSLMNFNLPSLNAVVRLSGDSLKLIDDLTFKKIGKWLLFKNKNRNLINHVSAEMLIENNEMKLFPFMFDFDRYRIGIQGHNDFAMNFNYRISVLKSPLPFKFGINIKGTPDKYKVSFGGAKFNEKTVLERKAVADTTRINLLKQISDVFKRGVRNSRFAGLILPDNTDAAEINLDVDTVSAADSAAFIREGLIPAPEILQPKKNDKRKNARKN